MVLEQKEHCDMNGKAEATTCIYYHIAFDTTTTEIKIAHKVHYVVVIKTTVL